MKNKIYIQLLVLIISLIVGACAKNDLLDRNNSSDSALCFNITLRASETVPHAAESDNEVLKIASSTGVKPPHIMIETYTGIPGSSLNRYFSDELGYFSSGNYWDVNSGITRFLPSGGMNLYSYFATDFADKGELFDVIYTHPTSATTYPTLTFTATASDALHQVDLIAAKVENISHPDILIPFRHILCQINFGVKGINGHNIIVKNIRLNNIIGKGVFDYNSWSWTPENSVIRNYPYYFPDRNERELGSGTGQNYTTQGTATDSENTYIFGDGGKFGPGSDNTLLYAQIDPIKNGMYATRTNISGPLHNSLMLIPQEITKNPNATVTFDYEIKSEGLTIHSGTNCVVRLDQYYDWKPNLRYVYIFDFDDLSKRSKVKVLVGE